MFNLQHHVMRGFTLIELLISFAMSSLIIGVMFDLYLNTLQSQRIQKDLVDLQANASVVVSVVSQYLQHVNDFGPAFVGSDFPISNTYLSDVPDIRRFSSTESELQIYHRGLDVAAIEQISNHGDVIKTREFVRLHHYLVISDITHIEISKIKAIPNHAAKLIHLSYPLQTRFRDYAEIGQLELSRIYVAPTRRHYPNGALVMALYLDDLQHAKVELVDGIEYIKFHYYSLIDGSVVEVDPQQITYWSQVAAVSIEFGLYVPPFRKKWFSYVAL